MPIVVANNPAVGVLAGMAYASGKADFDRWSAERDMNAITTSLQYQSRQQALAQQRELANLSASLQAAGIGARASESEKARQFSALQAKQAREGAYDTALLGQAGAMQRALLALQGRSYPGSQYAGLGASATGIAMPAVVAGTSAQQAKAKTKEEEYEPYLGWFSTLFATPATDELVFDAQGRAFRTVPRSEPMLNPASTLGY